MGGRLQNCCNFSFDLRLRLAGQDPHRTFILLFFSCCLHAYLHNTSSHSMASFYLEAAGVLDAVAEHTNSLKATVANWPDGRKGGSSRDSKNQAQKRRLLALCADTLAFAPVLDELIERAQLLTPSKQAPNWIKGGAAPPTSHPSSSTPSSKPASRKRKRPPVEPAPPNPQQGKYDGRPSAANLARVLLHDLLLSPAGKIQAGSSYPPLVSLTSQRVQLHAILVRIQLARGAQTLEDLRADREERKAIIRVPRWVRLIPSRVAAVPESHDSEEFTEPQERWEQWLRQRHSLRCVQSSTHESVWLDASGKEFAISTFVPHVYAFHPCFTSTLLASNWYQYGAIVLQDLASCFPAQLLASYYFSHHPDGAGIHQSLDTDTGVGRALHSTSARALDPAEGKIHALDATAAPGNKTSHLSSLLNDLTSGWKVGALERDRKRYQTLMGQLSRVGALASGFSPPTGSTSPIGAKNTTAVQGDFLALDPAHDDWSEVRILLLDPSCSGSGILGRWDQLTSSPNDGADDVPDSEQDLPKQLDRLAQLSALQVKMIEQAMKFPALEAFTYSTCSVHREENEEVVSRALRLPLAQQRGWRLVPASEQGSLAHWPHRGAPPTTANGTGEAENADNEGGELKDFRAVLRAYPGGLLAESESGSKAERDSTTGACNTHASNGFFVALFARNSKAKPCGASKRKRQASSVTPIEETDPVSRTPNLSDVKTDAVPTKLTKNQKKKLKKRQKATPTA